MARGAPGSAERRTIGEALTGAAWIAVPLLLGWLLLQREINDSDIYWQAALGDLALQAGGPITREVLAPTYAGTPTPPLSALGQVILALVRRLGDWRAVQVFDAALCAGGFFFAGLAARRRGAGMVTTAAALVLACGIALSFLSLRPQSWSVLGFGLLLWILTWRGKLAWQLAGGAAVLVLWQNMHPSVMIAAVYLGARAVPGWLSALRSRDLSAIPLPETALAAIAAAAQFATPAGFDVLAVSLANQKMSVFMAATEWLPVSDPGARDLHPLLLTLHAGVLAMIAFNWQRIDWGVALGALAFLALSFVWARFMLPWAIALAPLLAVREKVEPQGRHEGWGFSAGFAALAALAVLKTPVAIWPLAPEGAISQLRALPQGGRIFANSYFGGIIADETGRKWQSLYDGRYYRFSEDEWRLYNRTFGGEAGLAEIEARFRPDAWLIAPNDAKRLVADLRAAPSRWREVPGDGKALFFVKAP
ncbi:hypothetical protein [Novosphingobium aquae]|uniref:Glycosyltransferase RgtA/B/C/D-like domain-containing protein n=1 Tax=Novosphingobium aquae TaxID=3133435 RepID=A0ABU8SAY1_9SPHN